MDDVGEVAFVKHTTVPANSSGYLYLCENGGTGGTNYIQIRLVILCSFVILLPELIFLEYFVSQNFQWLKPNLAASHSYKS